MNLVDKIENNKYDVIIVGSGFSGSISANHLANQNKKVLVIEKRNHIAGNMFDCIDENGVLIQKYGPHILRSHTTRIYDYLSNFGEFFPYRHIVEGQINDDVKIPLPFNLNSLKIAFPKRFDEYKNKLVDKFGYESKVTKNDLLDLGLDDLYEFISQNIFVNYTNKQWKEFVEYVNLDEILGRVPLMVLTNRDGYFSHKYQKMPTKGFTYLFENMLNHENIDIILNTDASKLIKLEDNNVKFNDEIWTKEIIYTGPIDELASYKFGKLSYLSVDFEYKVFDRQAYQNVGTINYPNSNDFTRITEFKYLGNQELDLDLTKTVTVSEVSRAFDGETNERYYPIPAAKEKEKYEMYKKYFDDNFSNIHFLGRLAEYKYLDMDVIIEKALDYMDTNFKNEK